MKYTLGELLSLEFTLRYNQHLSSFYSSLRRSEKGQFKALLSERLGVSLYTARSYVLGHRRLRLMQLKRVEQVTKGALKYSELLAELEVSMKKKGK